ncbi:hypothetical protein [Bradyrhizobium sp. USDA 3364]
MKDERTCPRRVFPFVPFWIAAVGDRGNAIFVQSRNGIRPAIVRFSATGFLQWSMPVKYRMIAACLAYLAGGGAFAQVTGMAPPTPTVGATSPLGSSTGSPLSPLGIGLGATELASPGVSPAPTVTGSIAAPSHRHRMLDPRSLAERNLRRDVDL